MCSMVAQSTFSYGTPGTPHQLSQACDGSENRVGIRRSYVVAVSPLLHAPAGTHARLNSCGLGLITVGVVVVVAVLFSVRLHIPVIYLCMYVCSR